VNTSLRKIGEIDARRQRWITARKGASSGKCDRTDTHRRSRRASARGFSRSLRPRQSEGAGNAGCALHPRSRVQCAREVRTRAYRAAESIRHSLRNGFTTYSALSLVIGFLATIAGAASDRRSDRQPADLTPAPRRQDHTSSPYASATLVSRSIRVHRNPPHVRDDGRRPSERNGMATDMPLICPSVKEKYF